MERTILARALFCALWMAALVLSPRVRFGFSDINGKHRETSDHLGVLTPPHHRLCAQDLRDRHHRRLACPDRGRFRQDRGSGAHRDLYIGGPNFEGFEVVQHVK